MKRVKKPKPGTVRISVKDIKQIKKDVTEEAVGMASLLYMVAAIDEFGLTDEDIEKLYIRATRYASYIDEQYIRMKNLSDSLYKSTGKRIIIK